MITVETKVLHDLDEAAYHASPGLSYSGAKALLPPSCPAKYQYDRTHPRPPKREFDLGHAAHRLVLGAGAELVVVDAANYLTKAAKEARDAAYDAGQIPLLPREHDQVQAMARAVREHPLAGPLFTAGQPEVSLFWTDEQTGVPLRARLDWLKHPVPGRPLIIGDLKTTELAYPGKLPSTVDEYRYHIQAAVYLDGAAACGLTPPEGAAFVFAFVEKKPPHCISVIQVDHRDITIGRDLASKAMQIWRDCTTAGVWPSYPDDRIHTISLAPYARNRHEEVLTND